MKLDLDHVMAFWAVATEGSFTKAALTLNSGQSRMSSKVKALEERLGTRLFARSTRFVELTKSGELLLTYAKQLADTIIEVEAVADKLSRNNNQVLRIGASACTAMTPERAILTDIFGYGRPDLRVEIEEGLPTTLLERLHRHHIDLALVPGPLPCNDLGNDLEVFPLRTVASMLVVPEDHILARFDSIPPERMRGQQIAFSPREAHPSLYDKIVPPLEQLGAKIISCPDPHILARMRYAKTRGMLTWCQGHEDLNFSADGFVLRHVRGLDSEAVLYLARRKDCDTICVDAFRSVIDGLAGNAEARVSFG